MNVGAVAGRMWGEFDFFQGTNTGNGANQAKTCIRTGSAKAIKAALIFAVATLQGNPLRFDAARLSTRVEHSVLNSVLISERTDRASRW